MKSETEQTYKDFNRQLQIELAEKFDELRPILAEIIDAESKQGQWLANWGNRQPLNNYAMADIKEQIESELTTRQVMEHYGVHFNRRGFALCPFHAEKTPSLSIKNNYYKCFGCGASGDLFTFVMESFGIGFTEAIEKLCSDFSIGPVTAATNRAKRAEQIQVDREAHNDFRQLYLTRVDAFRFLHSSILKYRPTSEDSSTWHPLFIYAVHRIGQLEYWLDKWADSYSSLSAFTLLYREEADWIW